MLRPSLSMQDCVSVPIEKCLPHNLSRWQQWKDLGDMHPQQVRIHHSWPTRKGHFHHLCAPRQRKCTQMKPSGWRAHLESPSAEIRCPCMPPMDRCCVHVFVLKDTSYLLLSRPEAPQLAEPEDTLAAEAWHGSAEDVVRCTSHPPSVKY